jgi:NAD(P)-dependent dehydrogenase (short-subunit alcohol dehydrogenase family)
MDLELNGRPALVTGGSRGIGRAIARALLREGARVAIANRNLESNQAAVAALAAETGGTVVGLVGDIARPDDAERLVAETVQALGGLHILVNAAGRVSGDAPEDVEAVEESLIRQDFEEKVLGYLRLSRAAIPYMREAGYGRIISLSGNAARTAGAVSAGIRNAAVIHMTKTLAMAYGRDNITCHALCPAVTLTERVQERLARRAAAEGVSYEALLAREARHHAIGRLVTADEVADVAVFLASPRSAAITGEVIAVTGGGDPAVRY